MTGRVEHIGDATLYLGDCREILPTLDKVHTVVTDPPYAEIDRDYGRLTECEWHSLMDGVVVQCRRLVVPSGSAVFILQPNSERIGRMRPWLFEFIARWAREWNVVQDAWWWNFAAAPTVHCRRTNGLMRPSLKACVWLGDPNCYRNQDSVLLPSAEATLADKRLDRHTLRYQPSGMSMRDGRALSTARERGGSTPFNVIVCGNSDQFNSAGANGHGAGTPMALMDWWVKYLAKDHATVCDPFMGSGTTGVACARLGRRFIGIEIESRYFDIACRRIDEAQRQGRLFDHRPPKAEQMRLLAEAKA